MNQKDMSQDEWIKWYEDWCKGTRETMRKTDEEKRRKEEKGGLGGWFWCATISLCIASWTLGPLGFLTFFCFWLIVFDHR